MTMKHLKQSNLVTNDNTGELEAQLRLVADDNDDLEAHDVLVNDNNDNRKAQDVQVADGYDELEAYDPSCHGNELEAHYNVLVAHDDKDLEVTEVLVVADDMKPLK